jgi:quercetin dioxygenase-like cupin family protein
VIRVIVAGLNPEGAFTVISDGLPATIMKHDAGDLLSNPPRPVGPDAAGLAEGEALAALPWSTSSAPPEHRYPGQSSLAFEPLDLPPGHTRLVVLQMAAHTFAAPHRTNTLDYDAITAGSGQLLLDTGAVDVAVGDIIVIPGVPHGWKAGLSGMTFMTAITGLAESD